MPTTIIKREGNKMTITLTVESSGSMLEMEEQIQKSVNELGRIETVAALEQVDTNGTNIAIEGVKLTSPIKGQGYRGTMNGSISLFNKLGERVHTIYVAKAPEYGKKASMNY